MIKSTLALIAFSFTVSGPLFAADKPDAMQKNLTQSCQSDIQKYCSDVSKGEGRIMACLRAHDDKLSDNCNKQWQQAKAEWKSTMKGMHAACSGDVQKFCGGADNPKEVMSCLDDHKSDLTTACRDFREKNTMSG